MAVTEMTALDRTVLLNTLESSQERLNVLRPQLKATAKN